MPAINRGRMTLFQLISSDYKKYRRYGASFPVIVFLTQGFWASFQYRFAHWVFSRIKIQPFRAILLFLMLMWRKLIEILTGISIPASVKIGHSFYIAHFGGIILNSGTVIGNNCNISQGVTIGVSGTGDRRGVPTIGNNVYVGANSVIAGKIVVGDNVLVGACSLVSTDAAENSVMVGVPAQAVSFKSSIGYI